MVGFRVVDCARQMAEVVGVGLTPLRTRRRRECGSRSWCGLLTLVVVAERSEPVEEGSTYLLASAVQLRQAALHAGRLDVVAKADEIIALLATGADDDPTGREGQQQGRDDARNAVLRLLDGLGF
jgi:hypothetical protein